MKKIIYLLLSTSILCTLASCSKKESKDQTSKDHTAISVAINDVYLKNIENSSKIEKSAKLLDALNQNENIMISMTSLDMALGMVLNGSIGETKEGIEKFIGMSTEDANSYYI